MLNADDDCKSRMFSAPDATGVSAHCDGCTLLVKENCDKGIENPAKGNYMKVVKLSHCLLTELSRAHTQNHFILRWGKKVKIGTESTSNYGLGIVPSVLVLQAFTHHNK